MFADSLLETSWAQRSRRSWTTLTSFGLQAFALVFQLAIPLFRSAGVPAGNVLHTPVSWGAPTPAAPPAQRQHVTTLNQSNYVDRILVAPPSIPTHIAQLDESVPPPQVGYRDGSGIGNNIGDRSPNGVFNAIGDSMAREVSRPVLQPTIQRAFRTSSMLQGSLIHRVDPVYPPLARNARIQGAVVLEAVIGKDGAMENLRLISGHPMLAPAAIQAVSQWRYRPYILNGEAIEVETQITVNFILGGN